MFDLQQYIGAGAGAATIAAKVETAIADGRLAAGDRLPTIRDLAARLRVSPATVAAAYRTLGGRGLVSGNTRLGTVVTAQPAGTGTAAPGRCRPARATSPPATPTPPCCRRSGRPWPGSIPSPSSTAGPPSWAS